MKNRKEYKHIICKWELRDNLIMYDIKICIISRKKNTKQTKVRVHGTVFKVRIFQLQKNV